MLQNVICSPQWGQGRWWQSSLECPKTEKRSQPVRSQVLLSNSPIRGVTPTPLGKESEGMGPETEELCKWTPNPSTWNHIAVGEDDLSPSLFKRGSTAFCMCPISIIQHNDWHALAFIVNAHWKNIFCSFLKKILLGYNWFTVLY